MPEPKSPNASDVLGNRFHLRKLLGRGAFASVWLVFDSQRQKSCVLKLYPKDVQNAPVDQYRQYLEELQKRLAGAGLEAVTVPVEIGEIDDYTYQVSEYEAKFASLGELLSTAGALHPREALAILSRLAKAVGNLHARGLIHADLKPANVLISDDPTREVRVIDFGMVRPVEGEDAVLVFSTYSYLHPDLVASTKEIDQSTTARILLRAAAVGPYIDVYALGVIGLEILSGTPSVPRPLSKTAIGVQLRAGNPWLRQAEDSKVAAVAGFLHRLLTVRVRASSISASTAASVSESLISLFPKDTPRAREAKLPISEAEAPRHIQEVAPALRRIELLGKQLATETAAFVLRGGAVQSIVDPTEDERLLADVNRVFKNAIQRAKASWTLSVTMTVAAFVLLVSMIVSAITITIMTGETKWTLIFGGVGVSTVIGTLIWRPYDRLFRATILTQQIEMIHVQIVAGFRGTANVEERLRTCREAIAGLRSLVQSTED
jgi:serine/threonine protein kinase